MEKYAFLIKMNFLKLFMIRDLVVFDVKELKSVHFIAKFFQFFN